MPMKFLIEVAVVAQLSVKSLEQEINEIEEKLKRSEGYLRESLAEEEAMDDSTKASNMKTTLEAELENTDALAKKHERSFVTQKGVLKWSPISLTDTELSFVYLGPSSKCYATLSFRLHSDSSIVCDASIEQNLFHLHRYRLSKATGVVASFLHLRFKSLCADFSQKQLTNPQQIGDCLRLWEWAAARIEMTALEFATLKSRYNADVTLTRDGELPYRCILIVDFYGSNSEDTALRASFEVGREYPFSPLQVQLDTFENHINIDAVRKLLIRNAKPGFGYLSRTCDVLAAWTSEF
jgi:hypothetical protein